MKQYLLLRNNHQSGPFAIEELEAGGLRPMDLIWIEGQSTSWAFATELDELKSLVSETSPRPAPPAPPKPVFVALPEKPPVKQEQLAADYAGFPQQEAGTVPGRGFYQPLEVLRERQARFREEKNIWQRKFSRLPEVMNLAAVFTGVVFGAFLIKKAVDGFAEADGDLATTAAAQVIPMEPIPEPQGTTDYQNAVRKDPAPMTRVVEKRPLKTAKPKDIKKQIVLKSSDYKVGIFGGISGLQLQVYNGSPHFVNRLTVSVDYLKPNGEVVASEQVELSSIRPGSTKTLAVPGNNRGVKVRCQVVNISSEAYKAALKQV
ncbi:MAG TPA: hypothetical protein VFR58_08195 [Flavisolibacter sp.]|nr:hypothetical protein [Flavisolibacter sp.]